MTVFENEGNVKKFFVSSGSVTINEDASVQILAEEAHPLEDLVLSYVLNYFAQTIVVSSIFSFPGKDFALLFYS